METSKPPILTEKSSRNFNCTYCDYLTSRKSNFDKHLTTRKHQKNVKKSGGNTFLKSSKKVARQNLSTIKCTHIENISLDNLDMSRQKSSKKSSKSSNNFSKIPPDCSDNVINITQIPDSVCKQNKVIKQYNCAWCNKYYKSRSGHYKHERMCKNKMEQLEKKLLELEDSMENKKIGTQYNTTNNITIQLFLNENCKNAIPIESFVKNLQITMEDLFNSNKIGYVDGISSIIVKNLQDLEVTERPIHCSDSGQRKFYVKSEKEWKKDNGDMVDKAVENVKKEAHGTISKYMQSDISSEEEELQIMKVLQILNKVPPSKVERNEIIKKIGDSVILDDKLS